MAEAAKPEKKKMPKGGRRGGTLFPKINLQKALEYSKKLVSKTHNGPQPEQTILVGVFNNKGPGGGVRASALKQYGLMEGDTAAYSASPLARQIEAAIPEERPALTQRAFLTPKLFKQIYDTLQSETASRARVRQVVVTAKVHPDSADECVACFIDGAVHSGLGTLDGENVVLVNAGAVVVSPADGQDAEELEEHVEETEQGNEAGAAQTEAATVNNGSAQQRGQAGGVSNADVRVNLAVDSSSDPDKLEKQLKLLKQYGLLR